MTDQNNNLAFLLPYDMGIHRLIKRLGGEARCRSGDTVPFSVRFFDSFDWRLHAEGLRLLQVETPQGRLLRLRAVDGSEHAAPEVSDVDPAWPADLPDGELRRPVAKALGMRVLLPMARVFGEVTEIAFLNDDAKTVVRLQYLRLAAESPDVDEPRQLLPRVRLLEVRGYEAELAALGAQISDTLEWPAAPDCLFDEAITAVGREPGDYSSKLDIPMRPGQTALTALRQVFLNLLGTIERNVAGARADLDSEFLHDLRVATRRTRSALAQVRRVLPEAVVAEFKTRFAWLGQVTGPTRDLDVFLLELPSYRASLPGAMAGDLDPLEQHLRAAQHSEQAKLRKQLGSKEMKALVRDWRALLEAEVLPGEPGWFADLPIEKVASQRIWRVYKKVLKAGRAVRDGGAPEQMHELRKDCKKLRYLIEFFRRLFPDDDLKGIVRALKELLDILGTYQDRQVQAERLVAFAREIDQDEPHAVRSLLAIGGLVVDLLRDQRRAHERFADAFAAFDSASNRNDYKRLFKELGAHLG